MSVSAAEAGGLPSKQVGQTAESLSALMRCDEMAERRARLIRLGSDLVIESGFAAYDDGTISEVVHPELDGYSHTAAHGGLAVDLTSLTGALMSGSFRRDLLMTTHTHPPKESRSEAKAYPSSYDNTIFKEINRYGMGAINCVLSWSARTPVDSPLFTVRGMRNALTARGRERYATLFLARANPGEFARVDADIRIPVEGYFPGYETWPEYTRSADSWGINYAQATVHPRTGRIIEDDQLPHLFYEGPLAIPRDQRLK